MEAVDSFLARCAECTTEAPTAALREATGAFLAWARDQPEGAPPRVLDALSGLPPRGAAWLALTLGSAIESGAPAEASGRAVTGLLRAWLDALPLGPDEADVDLDDAQHGLVLSMPYLCQSVVAHLARLPALRSALASDAALLARLRAGESLTYGASWVYALLARSSGELVVIHVESRRALALSYANVGTAFHLFTLVQGAIGDRLPGGRAPDRSLVAAARGRETTEAVDEAWWHYQDHRCRERAFAHSIWAELSAHDIPKHDGVLVLVLWPKILGGRHWGADFFGPTLQAAPSSVSLVRELSRAEAEGWLAKLGIAPN